MFDVGFSELVVIALVALIVLGPKRLPEVARTAGQWLARLRRFVSDVKQDFDRELQHADLAELQKLRQELDETRRVVEETSSRLIQQANIDPAASQPAVASAPPAPAPTAPAEAPAPAVSSLPPLAEPPGASKPPARRAPKRSRKTTVTKNEDGGSG